MAQNLGYTNIEELFADFDLTTAESKDLLEFDRARMEPKILTFPNKIFLAVNYALGSSTWIVTPKDTIIVIDVPENLTVTETIRNEMRNLPEIGNKPISTIVYTIFHIDHTGGAKVLVDDPANKGIRPNIIAHKYLIREALTHDTMKFLKTPRTARMFGITLPKQLKTESTSLRVSGATHLTEPPTDLLDLKEFGEVEKRNIDGLQVEFYHLPGFTKDLIIVWLPELKVVMASDVFYILFPNLYTIRGEPARDALQWAKSVRYIRDLKPELLLPQHSTHLSGAEFIQNTLEKYADIIQFMHDQTVRMMSKGLNAEEIAQKIRIPDAFANEPFLLRGYGMPSTNSKAIVDLYIGWFSGDAEDMFALDKKTRSKKMLKAFGRKAVMDSAIEAYKERDYQWALELTTLVFLASDRQDHEALYWRSNSVKRIAERVPSANVRHFLLTIIAEDWGLIKPPALNLLKVNSVSAFSTLPIDGILNLLKYHLDDENAANISLTIHLKFSPTHVYKLQIRNVILDTEKVDPKIVDNDVIAIDLDRFRSILSGNVSMNSKECPSSLLNFLKYFDFNKA